MRNKKAKWLHKLVATRNPVLLLMIRNNYGESTQGMEYRQLYKKAKTLYKLGIIQTVKNWPSMDELRKMKGKELFNVPLRETESN